MQIKQESKYPNETFFCTTPDGNTISIFRPSLFHVIPKNSGNLETEAGVKLRFFYRMLIGYRIYVMRREDTFLAYVMFQKGKIARYPFVKKGMLLMGPYFVNENFRGQGYAGELIDAALMDLKDYSAVFAWIASSNHASRRALTKAGFEQVGWLNVNGIKKEVVQVQTQHELWKKDLKRI